MAGSVWEVPIKFKGDMSEIERQTDQLKKGLKDGFTIDIGVDKTKVEKVISDLEKMLTNLGKGTGDFKQFEKLSDELKNIKKSLGGIDDKGVSNLYNSINNIDKALSSLTEKLQVVKKDANGNLINTSQIGELADLFVKIEEHLNSIHKAFGEVGKDKGLAPLINQVNELKAAMSGLKLNFNLDLGNSTSLDKQIESKSVNLLSAYRNLFKQLNMNSSGALNQQINEFLNGFDNKKSVAEQNALYANFLKQIRNQAKVSNINGRDYVKDWAGKEYWSAVSGAKASLTKAEKSASSVNDELKNIFGGSDVDLTGVISQLETIADKLDNIASSAKTMGEAFSSGLNVSASLEEITKLTERVKELESELQKVKSVGGISGDKTDLSSGGKVTSGSNSDNKDAQKSVNQALKTQLSAWKGIQSVREQLSKTTDTSQIESLKKQGQLYLEEYNNAGKILQVNKELYDSHAHINEMMLITLKTNDKIAQSQTNQAQKQKASIDQMVSSSQKIVNSFSQKNNVHPSDEYVETVKKATNALEEMQAIQKKIENEQNGVSTDEQSKRIKELKEEIEDYNKTVSKMTPSEKGSTLTKAEKEIKKINQALDSNTRMSSEAKAQLTAYINELKNNPAANVEEIAAAWMKVVNTEKEAGRGGKSLFSAVGEKMFYGLASQIANMVSLYDVINVIKQAATEVVNINSAFTDLSKVSDITLDNLESQLSDFSDIAKNVGATITDTIDATSNWSRNGYNLADSKELAKVSLIYKNVGDGIDIDEANSSLVSTLQGFNLQASDAMSVIDRFNEVSNNFAIDSGGIGEALQRSAASFNAANTDLSKSIALITGTNVTLQDPDRVGNMWKTVSARLRGAESELTEMGEDTDGMVESTSKLREIIKGMTGFDIMADEAGTQFKDIYDIVVGIGEKWQDLNDIDRASLLEKLAGKNQSNALAAALNNVQTIKDAYQTAENSTGSAMQEQSRYEQSIQYSIDRIKASAQQLAATSFDSSFLKGLVDTGNAGVEVITKLIDKVGILGTALGGVGIFSFIKNLDLFITKLVTSYTRIQRKWFCKQVCVVTF